ncbi:hypothetical protein [Staphylococcus americanisciuri]|uniref:Mobilization protein n=1 Tax=Staphylococcus americanisciuri TaxID=2973940 RepID=A0ABT2F0L0_9STAP|nr:hypothetical protein [Staphylococcus americanisciuri]MCS4485801.1 hypothetical protein [Staphylococcus americanisciuri]
MENSLFWSRNFIPVYFIVAFLTFLLFKFYIRTDNIIAYLPILLCVVIGIASLIYNFKEKSD